MDISWTYAVLFFLPDINITHYCALWENKETFLSSKNILIKHHIIDMPQSRSKNSRFPEEAPINIYLSSSWQLVSLLISSSLSSLFTFHFLYLLLSFFKILNRFILQYSAFIKSAAQTSKVATGKTSDCLMLTIWGIKIRRKNLWF